ncbi:ATP-grasp domain-containing protein [Bradyrhizobium sp. CCGB20]|uniref:ATP-grasp domain-containing protein n=1 Tax=Bradyrhizobium sp. CCGB20 TaxID=2949633 RepID=UPI0020B3A31E|nr:ATP-grasp domain-containing protein [Bradyrhizobium sp. CCGB20]MCP3400862.1 acetate--CoA ligase family protein [Bradyrhizobium sp. CCGB20]
MHFMLVTEAQGKALLRAAAIATPSSQELRSLDEARSCRIELPVAVKAQVAAGGRGKAGGIRKANSPAELENAFDAIMGMRFAGEAPASVLVESWLDIERELYLAVAIDSRVGGFNVLYSPRGGVTIEDGPPPLSYPVGLARNFRAHAFRTLLAPVESDPKVRERVISLARRLLDIAQANECTTVEINPLVVARGGALIAADAKVVLDEAAAFRKAATASAIAASRDRAEREIRLCEEASLMLVWLDGEIGLISGGAGMTMAAMDAIDGAGAQPACFLDVSGNPTPAGFGLAFDLLDRAPNVKGILVSMFGGGLHTDRVAKTLVELLARRTSSKPVTLRLNGTRSDLATTILRDAGHRNHATLEAAVTDIVKQVGEARS